MENNIYNSLTEKLIQNGILTNEKPQTEIPQIINEERNIFKQNASVEIPKYMLPSKKRLNQLDLELLNKRTVPFDKTKKTFLRKKYTRNKQKKSLYRQTSLYLFSKNS